jgi:predicted ATPase/DNA-binding SARP family transcriptional activator
LVSLFLYRGSLGAIRVAKGSGRALTNHSPAAYQVPHKARYPGGLDGRGPAETTLEFRLLGPFEVARDGVLVDLGRPKERALLALLLLNANEVVSTDRLIEELWPEKAPRGAAHTIQVFVSRLRKAVGKEVLETRSPGYRVCVPDSALDVARFERLRAAGVDALERGRAAEAARTFAQALALFRGPPLAEFVYEPWAAVEVARLEEERLVCLEHRFEAEFELGRHAEIAAELDREATANPARERLRSQLMLSLYRSGRQAEALERYQQARTHLDEELGIEPSSGLKELYRRILNQDPALAAPPSPPVARIELPQPPTAFVGRQRELAEVEARLHDAGVRLLTLTGPGGSGKTRLALEAARAVGRDYEHGVFWVPLASVRDPSVVLPTIAAALELDGELEQAVAGQELLLVLDNLEQVIEAGADLGALLAAAPRLTLLVTSREPLRVYGEQEYRVPTLAAADAVELFLARVRAVQGESGSEETVRAICERLDHLPLAIELAAAHTRNFTPELIHARLQQRLPLLVGGPRDLDERQRTLRATIEWGYDLLAEEERAVFRRLGVFAGGAPLEAAESVGAAGLELIEALATKNLVRSGSGRVWMLETIREYAAERLADSAEAEKTRRAHALWCVEAGGVGSESLEQAWLELHNLRAARAWARTSGEPTLALELATKLAYLLSVRGSLDEARKVMETALAEADGCSPALRAEALHEAAGVALKQGDGKLVTSLSQHALRLAEEMGDTRAAVRALAKLATVALQDGDLERAAAYSKQTTEVALAADDERAKVNALNIVGTVELARKRYDDARAAFEQALSLVSEHLDSTRQDTVATLHYNIAIAACLAGDTAAAERSLARSLGLYRELTHLEGIAYCFVVEATRQARAGKLSEAAESLAAAEPLLAAVGAALEPVEQGLADSTWSVVEAGLDDEAIAAARRAGEERAEAESHSAQSA